MSTGVEKKYDMMIVVFFSFGWWLAMLLELQGVCALRYSIAIITSSFGARANITQVM